MKDGITQDYAFAAQHDITFEEAHSYRMGLEARERRSALTVPAVMSRYDAWYAAGFNDADLGFGRAAS
ncbi:hypothetical protein DFO67_13520 [Modicisalibacter xianhensis]|uniref:Uncharacterized protein n=1 Tax=Modicisalibacter xianhensis TaxID=442341 RepID=A0A4R8F7R2_9GAMM|nr:hypothetical protein [Halomonas xianhensis]TDX21610.1 hypothetical protein DFO67_13520 [Halomonas xianhensis]